MVSKKCNGWRSHDKCNEIFCQISVFKKTTKTKNSSKSSISKSFFENVEGYSEVEIEEKCPNYFIYQIYENLKKKQEELNYYKKKPRFHKIY